MKLLTKEIREKLLKNGSTAEGDFFPVVKLFTPDAQATWLLTEIDPLEPEIAFGLCDLGHGFPELGYVSLTELSEVRGRLGLPIERDRHFEAKFPISIYQLAAHVKERIVTDESTIREALKGKGLKDF